MAVLFWELASGESPNSSTRRINPDLFRRAEGCPEEFHRLYESCSRAFGRPSADEVFIKLQQMIANWKAAPFAAERELPDNCGTGADEADIVRQERLLEGSGKIGNAEFSGFQSCSMTTGM